MPPLASPSLPSLHVNRFVRQLGETFPIGLGKYFDIENFGSFVKIEPTNPRATHIFSASIAKAMIMKLWIV